jgi:hypothetical protein
MASSTTLHAWAVPAFVNGSPVDHTWVTNFDNQKVNYPTIADVIAAKRSYWFCWGSYHPIGGVPGNPTGKLGSRKGNLAYATCLVTPNADPRHVPAGRGTIFIYGVDGVCHQLANQVLYSTGVGGAAPMTVHGARGYPASSFIYGTYGLQHAAWVAKIASCGASSKVSPVTVHGTGGATGMPKQTEPDDFEAHARSVLADEPELLSRLLSLRSEVQSFAAQRIPGTVAPPAEMLNARNQHLLDEAARLLGPEKFEKVFGFKPEERINLVDPSLFDVDH